MTNSHIFQNTKAIIANSDCRISFEPKGIEKEFRNSLRRELTKLELSKDEILLAIFKNVKQDFFDVENILFYNIGTSSFKETSSNGIIFEYPDKILQSSEGLNNEYIYRIINEEEYHSSFVDEKVCDFEFVMDNIDANMKPHNYWYAFHRGMVKCYTNINNKTDYFGIDMQIHTPKSFYNLTSLIKPMLDGIISALHYELRFDMTGIERLSEKLNLRVNETIELLERRSYSILEGRRLLAKYRNGIKWNPEDERCRKVRIVPIIDTKINKIIIKGKINWLS